MRWSWKRSRIVSAMLVASALVVASLPGVAAPIVEFRLHQRFLSAPATVRLTIVVQPDAANRTLHVEIDGEDMYGSTDVTLEGSAAKRFHDVEFKSVPAGHYTVQATVVSADAVRGEARAELDVMGGHY